MGKHPFTDGSEISLSTKLSLSLSFNSVQTQLKLSLNPSLQGVLPIILHSNVFWAIIRVSLNWANLGLSPSLSRYQLYETCLLIFIKRIRERITNTHEDVFV